jgi:hypothetical protein
MSLLTVQQMEAVLANERMKGIVQGENPVDIDSKLPTLLSSRFPGLHEDWWKGKSPATLRVIGTRPKGKWLHWE